jgi:hypothetical protein
VLRGDKARAAREFGRAVQLGFDAEGAQRLYRRVLAEVDQVSGKLSDRE